MLKLFQLSDANQARQLAVQVAVLRWVIVIVLFFIVVVFEVSEHLIIGGEADFNFSSEVIFFGVLGPSMVFVVLSWVHKSLLKLAVAYKEIQSLNDDLERRIAARTRALENANTELRQLDRIKSEFVSLVSHELRAPLTNIQGGVEYLQQVLEEDTESRQILNVIHAEVIRLNQLIHSILDVSAIESGHIQLRIGPVALRPLIHQVWTRCLIPGQEYRLQLNIARHLPPRRQMRIG